MVKVQGDLVHEVSFVAAGGAGSVLIGVPAISCAPIRSVVVWTPHPMPSSETLSSSGAPRAPCTASWSDRSRTAPAYDVCVSGLLSYHAPSVRSGHRVCLSSTLPRRSSFPPRPRMPSPHTQWGGGWPRPQTFSAHGHTKGIDVLLGKGEHSVSRRMAMWDPRLAYTLSPLWPRSWTGGTSSGASMGARACVHGCTSSVVAYSENARR